MKTGKINLLIAAFAFSFFIFYNFNLLWGESTSKRKKNFQSRPSGIKFFKSSDSIFFVTEAGGLRMHVKPDTRSPMIMVIPDGQEVKALEYTEQPAIIDGIKAPWFHVKYQDKNGWVFSGFLESQKVKLCEKLDYPEIEIIINKGAIHFENDLMVKNWEWNSGFYFDYFILNRDGKGIHKRLIDGINEDMPIQYRRHVTEIIAIGDLADSGSSENDCYGFIGQPYDFCRNIKGFKDGTNDFQSCMKIQEEYCEKGLDTNGKQPKKERDLVTYKITLEKKGIVRIKSTTEKGRNTNTLALCKLK